MAFPPNLVSDLALRQTVQAKVMPISSIPFMGSLTTRFNGNRIFSLEALMVHPYDSKKAAPRVLAIRSGFSVIVPYRLIIEIYYSYDRA